VAVGNRTMHVVGFTGRIAVEGRLCFGGAFGEKIVSVTPGTTVR
jgi:hypothetical protein